MFKLILLLCFVSASLADLLTQQKNKGATLKPLSACCDIPELGNSEPLIACSNPKLSGPYSFEWHQFHQLPLKFFFAIVGLPGVKCNDVQCVFEKSGFLINNQTLNKDAYKSHLRQWADTHKGWSEAIEKAIQDCVEKEPRQYLDFPCKAYDVFTCTGIAMLKKCPKEEWIC